MKLFFLVTLICVTALLSDTSAFAQELPPQKDEPTPGERDHKLVSFREGQIAIRDFTYSTLEGQKINLREAVRNHKAVLVVFFAAWCENSAHDSETINALYRQYHDQGLAVIGVCNYSSRDELKEFITKHGIEYPVCMEGEAKTDDEVYAQREKTTHFVYRRQSGDKRKWGTPFTLLIDTKESQTEGESVTEKVHIAPGELKRNEAEKLVRRLLSSR